MSTGSTGQPDGGQPPAGVTPPGPNGSNGNGNSSANGNGRSGQQEMAGTRSGAGTQRAQSPASAPLIQPPANPERPQGPGGPGGAARMPAAGSAPRTQPSANPRPAGGSNGNGNGRPPGPGGQRPAPATNWAPKGRRTGVERPQEPNSNSQPPAAVTPPPPGMQNGRPGEAVTQATTVTVPVAGSRPENGVPVWDPPPPRGPKQSWRERLGLGKKDESSNGAGPGAGAAAVAGAAAMSTPPAPSAPPAQRPPNSPPVGPPPRTTDPGARSTGPAPTPPPNPAAPTSRAAAPAPAVPADAQTFGLAPSGTRPVPAAVPPSSTGLTTTTEPATTGGGGTAPPLFRTAAPVTAPTQPVMPAPSGSAGPGMAPPAGSTAVGAPGATPSATETTGPDLLATGKSKAGTARRTRKARLRLSRLDPWSVMKTSFLFSIAAGIMLVVATYAVWTVLSTSGLFPAVNDIVASVVSTPGDTTPFRIEEYINTQKVLGVAALIACVDVVIFTALATLGSFLYNLAATVLGGLEITLAED